MVGCVIEISFIEKSWLLPKNFFDTKMVYHNLMKFSNFILVKHALTYKIAYVVRYVISVYDKTM